MSYREFTEWMAFYQLESERNDPKHQPEDLDVDDQVVEAFRNLGKH